jgi:hypothetical protein
MKKVIVALIIFSAFICSCVGNRPFVGYVEEPDTLVYETKRDATLVDNSLVEIKMLLDGYKDSK